MTITETQRMDGRLFAELLKGGFANLRAHETVVNDLNVFPIPDGDTGNNMCLTVEGGVAALEEAGSDSLSEAVHAVSDGALLTARGNSGVILSQLMAGIAEGLSGYADADSRLLAVAARAGVKKAYDSVITPVEGTVLTVAREASEAVFARCEQEELTLEAFFSLLLSEMAASLQRTPELLPALREAGVIDSGGAGLFYLVEGMEQALGGATTTEEPLRAKSAVSQPSADFSGFTEDSELIYGYCTEFLLRLQNRKTQIDRFSVEQLIADLKKLGDSIVAFRNGSIVKVHIHTMVPGSVLALCQQYGEFLTMKIENMSLQHSEAKVENRFTPAKREGSGKKRFGVIAVASGEGLCEAFRRFGADAVIEGGQTMNPSAREFLEAFRKVPAETLLVLPNNANVLPAARQAAALYCDADVRVLESRTLGEGYQALTMLDFTSGDPDTVVENLQEAISCVTTGAVSRAVRDASLDGVSVSAGEYLGFVGKTLLSHSFDRASAACGLLEQLDTSETEVLVILIGAQATVEDLQRIRAYVRETMPHAELYELDGGQAVYDFLFVL